MGNQIIKQPDGRLAVFSSFTDTFVLMDATPDEVVEWFGERAAEAERDRTRAVLSHVLADNPRAAYFQFARTWEEACQMNQEHGGDLTYGDTPPSCLHPGRDLSVDDQGWFWKCRDCGHRAGPFQGQRAADEDWHRVTGAMRQS